MQIFFKNKKRGDIQNNTADADQKIFRKFPSRQPNFF